MLVTRRSVLTGVVHSMDIPVTAAELDRYYENSVDIQVALAHLSPGQREFIMTGVTPEEWAETFPRGEDET